MPEVELRPLALQVALSVLLGALVIGLRPRSRVRDAAALDVRLRLGDRLATAWLLRPATSSVARLQRTDAIVQLGRRSPRAEVRWRPRRAELGAHTAAAVLTLGLLISPSPQQSVLDRQAAEATAVQRASDRLDALRQEATAASAGLTPEQARRLDELLQRAQAELGRARTQREATTILASTGDQLTQELADPNADLRDEALAAMSETLAAEPLARRLAEALQHEDAPATSQALEQLAADADQMSDVERQALSRALQRAANVGRADPASASALREAARSLASGDSSRAALSAADAALRDSVQAATAQASLKSTAQRLRDLQAQLAAGAVPTAEELARLLANADETGSLAGLPLPNGTPVALDNSGVGGLRDPAAQPGSGAGVSPGEAAGQRLAGGAQPAAAENVFVPGREGNGPADQDLVEQPFTVRGVPRPYREVLGQYAQTGRDYVDRPDISPAVRDLVKQYFLQLEEGQ